MGCGSPRAWRRRSRVLWTNKLSPQHLLVRRDGLLPAALPREVGGDGGPRAAAGLAQPLGVGEQLVDALGETLDVAWGHQHEAVARGGDLLWPGLPAAADCGQPAGHRLDVGDPERLLGG